MPVERVVRIGHLVEIDGRRDDVMSDKDWAERQRAATTPNGRAQPCLTTTQP